MATLLHISDIHLREGSKMQERLLEELVAGVRSERELAPNEPATLLITGDLFDSGTPGSSLLVETFVELQARLVAALGGDAATIIVPGNHDRRKQGVIGPHREALFHALRAAVAPQRVHVGGCETPFLAEIVPATMHRLPAHLVAYDSSYLPHGLVGAGGTMRHQDLLQVHARLPDDDLPLILLVHHHLIPTPITDTSRVDALGAPWWTRWLIGSALPALVSNADREELTMTALGAGTALSTLHSLGRAVLLLHGHKHVPTARVLRGLTESCGDLLLASAGSAGRQERINSTRDPDAARLWPSFNVVDWRSERVHIETVSFSPRTTHKPRVRRSLVHVRRAERKWEVEPVTLRARGVPPRVEIDEAAFSLDPGLASDDRWDMTCRRTIKLAPGAQLRRYIEFVRVLPALPRGRRGPRVLRRVTLALDGETQYRYANALCRTLREAARQYGVGSAFESVGLLCRYGAGRATLRLDRSGPGQIETFGSLTDLTTGRERPAVVEASADRWTVMIQDCPPRSLLRIYWPLAAKTRPVGR
jgi:DNA repair exonuclease SbcCD nuclease subunit